MTEKQKQQDKKPDTGTLELAAGASFGAYGITLAVSAGVICPTCVIATPALLGYGLYKRHRSKDE